MQGIVSSEPSDATYHGLSHDQPHAEYEERDGMDGQHLAPGASPRAPGPDGWHEASTFYLDALGKDERFQRQLYAFSVDAWPGDGATS